MAVSKLPEIELECRNGHPVRTRARGGSTVRCVTCGAPKHVPADRPRTEREARDRAAVRGPAGRGGQADDPAAGSELADRWGPEVAWEGKLTGLGGRAGDECSECEGPLMWEPGRTVTYCPECKQVDLPAAVTEHYQRQSQRSAAVAVRAGADPAAERAARVRLRALIARMAERVGEWLEVFDPDDLDGGPARLARDYRAELAAYLPEIKNADDQSELAEIMADVNEVIERARTSGALDQIERQRDAIERQAELAERQAELAERQAIAAEQERRQAERERAERARQQITARPQPKAIAPRPGSTTDVMATVIAAIEQNRRLKASRLEKYGACDFPHRKPTPAERLYGIQTVNGWQNAGTGYQEPGTPAYRACSKHFAEADAAITKTGYQEPARCYWELKA